MKSRSFCTLHNCRRALIAVWIFALLLTAPSVWARVGLIADQRIRLYHYLCTYHAIVLIKSHNSQNLAYDYPFDLMIHHYRTA